MMTRARTPLLDAIEPQVLDLEYLHLPAEVRQALAELPAGLPQRSVLDLVDQARRHTGRKEGQILRAEVKGALRYAVDRGDLQPLTYVALSVYVDSLGDESV